MIILLWVNFILRTHVEEQSVLFFSHELKRKGWRKMGDDLKLKSQDFVRRHPNIIVSPVKGTMLQSLIL